MERRYFSTLIAILISILLRGEAFKIEISHFNDVSGQIESFVKGSANSSSAPKPCPYKSEENCIGGLVSIVHHVNEKFDSGDIPRWTIISGNVIGGESGWIPAKPDNNGWKLYAREIVREHYKPDVLALGMKEFGAGVPRATDFLGQIPNVAVLSNTCLKPYSGDEGTFCNETVVPKLRTITVADDSHSNYNIGILGFVTPTVERLSIPGKLEFGDVVSSLKTVVGNNANIKTFIAVGDGNLNMAKQIIEEVPKVKLVVYGAGLSNTQDMTNKYPLEHNNGYIVTAGRYGSTIGKLLIDVNSNTGDIKIIDGKIVPTTRVDPLNEAAQKALTTYTAWNATINNVKQLQAGKTRVTLQGGEKCWRQECNLGNLMTDAVVHCALQLPSKPFPFHIHAVWHGGAFFEDKIEAGSNITEFDIHKWLPYHNRAHLVQITGADLLKVFEESVKGVDPKKAGVNDWRQFLQVSSGLEVYIDTLSQDTPKLDRVRMTHDNDGVPALADIDKSKTYFFVIPTYLYEGRGVYKFTEGMWKDVRYENITNNNIGFDDVCLKNYINALWQVQVGFEERIWINADPDDRPSSNCPGKKTGLTVILTIIFFSLFLAIIYVGYYYVIPRLRRQPQFYPRNQD